MMRPANLVILGSTGSIGRQTLQVAERFPERLNVIALAANSSAELLSQQARAFNVSNVVCVQEDAARRVRAALSDTAAVVRSSSTALDELASLPEADIVLNALVGAAGLRASITALKAGKRLALANKESLVVGGDLVMQHADKGEMLPVDSEHSAIFQCLVGESAAEASRIWLTASGGPFRGMTRDQLASVTVGSALAHPRWTMGPKITIDSSTLMNKGLEAIEAHHLFDISLDDIKIVVHPQSCVHSMVEYCDGSVKAHLGATDMRIPIQYALSYPDRWSAPLPPVDFATLGSLEFEEPDFDNFPCLTLALDAGRVGGTMPAVMNASNEIAVAAFLREACGYLDIPRIVETVMSAHTSLPADSVEHIEEVDAWARARAESLV